MVRETGLEPASSYEHMNLNHARLPIPPFPQNVPSRAAQEAAQNAADALDPEEALEDDSILYAFQQANDALEEACDQADELVSLAEELNHEIRR